MEIKRINPSVRAGLLIGKSRATLLQRISELFPFRRLRKTGADFVVPNYRLVTPWLLRSCRKAQLNIYVWTVNGDTVYSKLIHKKVAGIITDYPERYDGKYTTTTEEELVC
jgi:glycerophosphoryl diester phosphodiesterase